MSLEDERDGRRRRKPEAEREPPAPTRAAHRRPPHNDVGDALRSAYQRMMDEDIPPEMLDLLGKLG